MPCARTTSQGSCVLAALARTGVVAVLAALLAGLAVPAPAQGAVAEGPTTASRGPAAGPPTVSPEPTTVPAGSADPTSSEGQPEPARLDGAVTPRRYGLPTVLAVVLALGVGSLLLRLLLAEPAARRPEPSAAPAPGRERGHGVGAPRW